MNIFKLILKKILNRLNKYFKSEQKTYYKRGKNFFSNSIIDVLTPQFIVIGENFISAPGSIILSHDASLVSNFGVYRVEKTIIGDNVFLGANSVILPGIKIGNNVIIGALTVVTRDIPSDVVVVGNPGRVQCKVEDYYDKCKSRNVLYNSPTMVDVIKTNRIIDTNTVEKIQQEILIEANNRQVI